MQGTADSPISRIWDLFSQINHLETYEELEAASVRIRAVFPAYLNKLIEDKSTLGIFIVNLPNFKLFIN